MCPHLQIEKLHTPPTITTWPFETAEVFNLIAPRNSSYTLIPGWDYQVYKLPCCHYNNHVLHISYTSKSIETNRHNKQDQTNKKTHLYTVSREEVLDRNQRRKSADVSAIFGAPPGLSSIILMVFESICRLTSVSEGFCQEARWWAFTSVLLFSVIASPIALIAGILVLANKREKDKGVKNLARFGIVAGVLLPVLAILIHLK